jgi:hypothetical protein
MSKSFIAGLIIGAILFLVVGVGAFRQKSQAINSPDADATPVQLGVMTDQQRIHGKKQDFYKDLNANRTIPELMSTIPNEDLGIEVQSCGIMPIGSTTAKQFYKGLTLRSDAVIRGMVKKGTSQITENQGFIFTDYEVEVSEILKNNILSPITIDNTIVVTRPGGKVIFNGQQVTAYDRSYQPLGINNEVVLFLQYIPETGGYQTSDPQGSFELTNSGAKPLSDKSLPFKEDKEVNTFLNVLRSISKN